MIRYASLLLALMLAAPSPAAERVLVGYYATFGKLPVEQIPWDRLTHVCHAFLRVDKEGELVTTDAMPNPALTADGRANDTPILVTIGGGVTVQGLEVVTATSESTAAFVERVMQIIEDGRYDGVDLDWEFPRNAATRDAHKRLVTGLRTGLTRLAKQTEREAPYLLTATVSPSPFFGQWIETDTIAEQVDWLNVMAYDLSGPWSQHAAHHAPLFASSKDAERATRSVAAAMRYWEQERGVPKEKLVVGAPLFGRAMPVREPFEALDPDLADRHRAMAFSQIRKLAGEGWPAKWDNESRAPWLQKPAPDAEPAASPLTPVGDDDDRPELISFDDRNSMHMKANWTREQGYRGMFFWAIHQDRMSDERHWLLDAANKAWPAD
ncbi:Chitinase B precursor [Planctomycetes bacterium MalM25]|nr:Chitinase B precursor [Planctomycetes bacterium MalM25]